MIKLKSLLNNKWFFPALVLYYGIFYILFGERYPFKAGFSTDGRVYESLVFDFTNSFYFDAYYVYRILPSLIIGAFLKMFSIELTDEHILIAFQILNIISLIVASYFLKQILLLFKISFKNQLLAFVLFLLNFGVIKYHFYFPSMTDPFALMLSTILLYFYLKNNILGVVISTILLAFTWPMAYYQGLLLIAFPICILPFKPFLNRQKILIYGSSIFYIIALSIIYVFIKKSDINVQFVAKIDRNLLPLSLIGIVLLFFFFAKLFLNKTLLDMPLFLKKINYRRLLLSFGVFALVFIFIQMLHPKPTGSYSLAQTLMDPVLYSLIKPFISIVAHVSYFGILVCLLLIFWSSFCKTVSQLGWGIVAAFGLNLILFGITPQSRHLINLLPWVVVFLVKAINKYSFSNSFYIVVGLLCFAASKVWLLLNIYEGAPKMILDRNGSLGFPDQILWMNIGPWMNEQMYYIQGGVALVFIGILFLVLYKVEWNKLHKIKLVRKYQISK